MKAGQGWHFQHKKKGETPPHSLTRLEAFTTKHKKTAKKTTRAVQEPNQYFCLPLIAFRGVWTSFLASNVGGRAFLLTSTALFFDVSTNTAGNRTLYLGTMALTPNQQYVQYDAAVHRLLSSHTPIKTVGVSTTASGWLRGKEWRSFWLLTVRLLDFPPVNMDHVDHMDHQDDFLLYLTKSRALFGSFFLTSCAPP